MNVLSAVSSTVGALELIMASVALYYSTKSAALSWLRYFALGLVLLSAGHLSPLGKWRPLFLSLGLPVLILSLLNALGFKRMRLMAVIATACSALYLAGTYLLPQLKPLGDVALFTALPVVGAFEVYSLYEDLRSVGLLLFFLGLVLYALSTDVRLVLLALNMVPKIKALTIEMLMRMVGVAFMLGGFLLA